MGLLDLTAKVLTIYQADTSQLEERLASAKGAEKDLAQQQLDAAHSRNEQMTAWKEQLDQVGKALRTLKEIADFVFESWKDAVHEARLSSAALGVDIDKLSRAAGGLKTNLELLDFAAKSNHASFHLTSNELAQMESAMRTLTERGFDATQVQQDFQNVLETGRTRVLAKYGYAVNDVSNTIDAAGDKLTPYQKMIEGVHHEMEFVAQLAPEAGRGMGAFGEEGEAAIVGFTDAWHELKVKIGETANELAPVATALAHTAQQLVAVAEAASKLNIVSLTRGIESRLGLPEGALGDPKAMLDVVSRNSFADAYSLATGNTTGALAKVAEGQRKGDEEQLKEDLKRYAAFEFDALKGMSEDMASELGTVGEALGDIRKKAQQQALEEWKKAHERLLALVLRTFHESTDSIIAKLEADADYDARRAMTSLSREDREAYSQNALARSNVLDGSDIVGPLEARRRLGAESDTDAVSLPALRSVQQPQEADAGGLAQLPETLRAINDATKTDKLGHNQTVLEKIFGKVEDFELYAKAFKSLEHVATSAFKAWIEGSEGMGTAFKRAVGESIEALAEQMLVESIKYSAYAIGYAIAGDPRAAGYAIAAAEFAAGAVTAGAIAHEMGASWGVGSGSSSAGGAGGGGRGGAQAPPQNAPPPAQQGPIIVYGDAFATDSPRMQQVKAQQLVDLALKAGRNGGSY